MAHLAGEGLTLGVMMPMFWANFVGGVLQAVAPQFYGRNLFHVISVGVLAFVSRSIAGCALWVWLKPVHTSAQGKGEDA